MIKSNIQLNVFALVAAAFTTIYITQPVLPVLQAEFHTTEARSSLTIAAVILGISLANLPFGMLVDRFPIQPIIAIGGFVIGCCGFFCAATGSLNGLIIARFIQGLFIPALTTCLAAFLSQNLPKDRLNVVMGSYVAATVAGGLGGRLLGGLIHPPLHWRYAFVSASIFLWIVTWMAVRYLPAPQNRSTTSDPTVGFLRLITCLPVLRIFLVAFGSFFVFSSVFNFIPFYLAGPPFHATTRTITFLYLSYVMGIVIGPVSGKLSNRIGNGASMVLGAVVFALALILTRIASTAVIAVSLFGVCAGFFTIHSAAAGLLNRRLSSGQGRANSLYVLFYYLGGYAGITSSGHLYARMGWIGVVLLCLGMLLVPLMVGVVEIRTNRRIR
ncbi:MAG: MFS transporter [Thermodesulfobacteriota bacterium]